MRGLAVALLLAGCTVEHTVLESRNLEGADAKVEVDARIDVRDCDQAWLAADGATCELRDVCVRASRPDPICCREVAFCDVGKLVHDRKCDPGCVPCAGDRECENGVSVCELDRCVPCPSAESCAECPAGFERLLRNGCKTCDCAPRSECSGPEQCGEREICYVGAACARGCAADLTCCANTCGPAEPLCARPAPLGCAMRCPEALGCAQCAGVDCKCAEGRWMCRPVCSPVVAQCFVP